MARILIVDDEPTVRKLLFEICRRAGYEVEVAQDGAEALHKVRNNAFDLITMDLVMANMDGVDAVAVIQNETDTPIVAISAHLTETVREDLESRNVAYFLDKPFSQKEVISVVQSALAQAEH